MQPATANKTEPRGCKAAGSYAPKNDLQAEPIHYVSRRARSHCTQKRGLNSPVRPQARGNSAKTVRSEKHGPAAIECHMRSLTGGCNSSLRNARR